MRKKLKLLVILLMIIIASSQQDVKPVELLCDEKNYKFFDNVERWSCYVSSLNIFHEGVALNSIKRRYWEQNQHKYYSYNCNNGVYGLVAENKYIFYIPFGLHPCFSKLLALAVKNSKLKKISQNDLEHFPRLELLDLSGNEIELLESYLFKRNGNLKYLNLNYNKIAVIEPNGLSDLPNLISFDFLLNICYSSSYGILQRNNSITEFIRDLKESCSIERLQNDIFANEKLNNILTTLQKLTSQVHNLSSGDTTVNKSLERQALQQHLSFNDSKYKTQNDDNIPVEMNQLHEQRTRFKHIIFILICAISLTYSFNVMIMYCLYPRDDNENRRDEGE